MKKTVRFLLFSLLISSLVSGTDRVAAQQPAASEKYFVYVGNYTAKTQSKGIYLYEFSPATGALTSKGLAGETSDPSWVVVHPNGKFLYSVNESGKASAVSAFSIDRETGRLTLLNKLPAMGEDPCYLSFDQAGKFLLVANYTSGNVVAFPILPNGHLGEHTAASTDQGATGPNKEHQDGPHAHWLQTTPDNRFLYVSDLGLDRVLVFRFDPAKGTLEQGAPLEKFSAALAPGDGPRHVTFSADRKFMYVLSELKSTVTVFRHGARNTFGKLQEISALPQGFTGRNDAAEITLLPSGKFLYSSNRGHDSIAVFAVDPLRGTLRSIADVPTGGKEPRHFAIDPTGHYLLAENQNSDTIVEFRIDPSNGSLTKIATIDNVISPISIAFLPVR